jgi:hypothetical protein
MGFWDSEIGGIGTPSAACPEQKEVLGGQEVRATAMKQGLEKSLRSVGEV